MVIQPGNYSVLYGPWKSRPLHNGLYVKRRAGTRLLVVGEDVGEDGKIDIRYQPSNRRGRVLAADLIDEHVWHLVGIVHE